MTIKFNSHTNNKTCIQNSTTERKTKRTAKLTMLLLPRLTKRVRAAMLKRREAVDIVALVVLDRLHTKTSKHFLVSLVATYHFLADLTSFIDYNCYLLRGHCEEAISKVETTPLVQSNRSLCCRIHTRPCRRSNNLLVSFVF